jgi:hypothetical protein
MTTWDASAVSATVPTFSPSPLALSQDLLPLYSPTMTSSPLSRWLRACACPWLPYPMIPMVLPFNNPRSASLS